MTDKRCPRCGGPMGEVEAPIWDTYCLDLKCNQASMRESIKRMTEERERKELARLKAKYE